MSHWRFARPIMLTAMALLLLAGLLITIPTARADSATIDFNSYNLGSIHTQDGWSSSGSAGSGCAVYDHAVVDNTYGYAAFGARSLRISNAVASGCFGDQTFSRSLADEAGETSAQSGGLSGGARQPFFEASWDFASTVPGSEQAGLSVVASPDRGDGARMSWVQMADGPSGLAVNFFDYQTGVGFVSTPLASGLDRTVPHNIRNQIWFVDGAANDIVRVWVDGVLEHTGTSWEDYFRDQEGNPTRTVDSILFRTSGTGVPALLGNGFLIDNLGLFSGPASPCTSTCYVDAVNGNDAFGGATPGEAKRTIQAGIDAVQPGGTVRVLPGSYSEAATNRYVLGVNGPHQFGLFIPQGKDGITIQGVTAGDVAITAYAGVLAEVATNATNSFGASGIFVEGDDVTIAGLRILPNTGGDNKTIEIIGDGFTLRDSHLAIPDGGSVYFNDWQYDTGANTSYIQRYTIDGNWLDTGTSIDLTSGAGLSGPASGRQITDNTFTNNGFWPSISFNGSGTGVPWFVQSVGGAVITGNSFTNTDPAGQHIRARGTYDNSQFDWASYWSDNTFNKAAVALDGTNPPFDVRTYSYTSGSYTFNNVRRIGAIIQPEINNAVAGDTVLVNEGSYPEQLTITKSLDLVGEDGRDNTTIQAPGALASDKAIVTIDGAGVQAEVRGFTVAGPGPGGCDSLRYGIFVRGGAQAEIRDDRVRDIRDQPLSGCQNGVAIQVGRASAGTTGSALIEDTIIETYQKNGVTVSGAGSQATIQDNTITGIGPTTVIAQNGIQFSDGAAGSFSRNTISGHSYTPFTYVSTGVLLFDAGAVNSDGNLISENQVGLYAIQTSGTHNGNTVRATAAGTGSAGFWGIVVDAPPPWITPSPADMPEPPTGDAPAPNLPSVNTVASSTQTVVIANSVIDSDGSAGGVGIEVDGGFGALNKDVTIRNNYITDWETGVLAYQCVGQSYCTSATITNLDLNHNSITGNGAGVVATSDTPVAIDAERNWWGSKSGPSGAGLGTGDSVAGAGVDFDPWLCSGEDTSAAIGFQPNPAASPCDTYSCPALDSFNRADGNLNRANFNKWSGPEGLGGYKVVGNRLDVFGGGPIYWKANFGSAQGACVTVVQPDTDGQHQALLLKVQGSDSLRWQQRAMISVNYSAGAGVLIIETHRPNRGWVTVATQPGVTLAPGDVLAAKALSDGRVKVYLNGALLFIGDTTATDGTFFHAKGGRTGLWFINAGDALLDDFGGGNTAP